MNKKELIEYTRDFRAGLLASRCGNPEDMCYAVCLPLHSLLEMMEVKCRLVDGCVDDGSGHYWLDMLDGNILDPTASQFRRPNGRAMPRVYHGPKPDWYHEYGTGKIDAAEIRETLNEYQKSRWPKSIDFVSQLNRVCNKLMTRGMWLDTNLP